MYLRLETRQNQYVSIIYTTILMPRLNVIKFYKEGAMARMDGYSATPGISGSNLARIHRGKYR